MTARPAIDPDAAPAAPVRAFVAIGSNVGDRAAHVAHAIDAVALLAATRLVRASTVHETEPVGPAGQGAYLNAVVELETGLSPAALLRGLLAIEQSRGRDRSREVRFGPRTLDLDILCWGDATPGRRRIESPGLSVPHPRMHERAFVLEPLAELAPDVAAAARTVGIQFPDAPRCRTVGEAR